MPDTRRPRFHLVTCSNVPSRRGCIRQISAARIPRAEFANTRAPALRAINRRHQRHLSPAEQCLSLTSFRSFVATTARLARRIRRSVSVNHPCKDYRIRIGIVPQVVVEGPINLAHSPLQPTPFAPCPVTMALDEKFEARARALASWRHKRAIIEAYTRFYRISISIFVPLFYHFITLS